MPSLKEMAQKPSPLSGGHRMCLGCSAAVMARQALLASDHPVVVSVATGCLEVTTSIFPFTAWKVPYIHSAFENTAATISGIETAYRALRKKAKLDREIKFIAFAGDGGTYDIGLQALSGALERGHDFVFICYDNGAYMNTGVQRSSATPRGAHTTTSPVGTKSFGKPQRRKDITAIAAAHHVPYVAQATPAFWKDFTTKVNKALNTPGPAFINVLSPCTLGWGFEPHETMEMARLAVETCFWPLYEVFNGQYKLNHKPKEKLPLRPWLEKQVRFQHLFQPGNESLLEELQREVDEAWEALLKRCEQTSVKSET